MKINNVSFGYHPDEPLELLAYLVVVEAMRQRSPRCLHQMLLIATSSKALVTTSVALVTNSFLLLLVRHLLLLAWHLLLVTSTRCRETSANSAFLKRVCNLVASLLLVAMPFAPSSFLLLVVRPGAPS